MTNIEFSSKVPDIKPFFDELNLKIQKSIDQGKHIGKGIRNNIDLQLAILENDKERLGSLIDSIDFATSNQCVCLVNDKLFSLENSKLNTFSKMFSRELDALLFNAFESIDYVESFGYSAILIKKDISDFMYEIIDIFADFNIDLVSLLKQNSDFEQKYGSYDKWKNDKIKMDKTTDIISDFCDKFNIDSYRTYKQHSSNDISIADLISQDINTENLIQNDEPLYKYSFSELWNDLEISTNDVIRYIENKILDHNNTEVPIIFIRRRAEEIYEKVNSLSAELYIDDISKAISENDSSIMDLSSDLHTESELSATLYTFYKDVLQVEISKLEEKYRGNISLLSKEKPKALNSNRVKSKEFDSCILYGDKEKLKRRLHEMIDGKSGKDVAFIISAAEKQGLIQKPSYNIVCREFGNIGAESGYNRYRSKKEYEGEYKNIKFF